jgi:N-acetylglutamate synthase-like GNAT family acetyltransferase
VGLVDLRWREREPAVVRLLETPPSSGNSGEHELAGTENRILVGWEQDGDLVAVACVERGAERDVFVHTVTVEPGRQGAGAGEALVEALVDVANAPRLIAHADAEAAAFFERCGFDVEAIPDPHGAARFRCARELDAQPAPAAAVTAATPTDIELAIRESWSSETSDDPDEWSADNPARGQCGVTALLVRELLGGEILVANVVRDGERLERHAWNRRQD